MTWSMERRDANHFGAADCVRFDDDELRLSACLAMIAWLEETCAAVEWPAVIWNVFAQMDGSEVWGGDDRETRVNMWIEFTDRPDLAVAFKLRFGGAQEGQ